MSGDILGWLERWVGLMARWRYAVLLAAAALTAASLALALEELRIDTDTAGMISPETAERRNVAALHDAFPQFRDVLVLVLDGDVVEEVEAAGASLARALQAAPGFANVFAPESDPFFRRNGLLYLAPERLSGLADRLAASAPLLTALAADPSLPGLFDVLGLAHRNVGTGAVPEATLADLTGDVAAVAEAAANGLDRRLSWRRLLPLGEAAEGTSRRLIVTQPRLDYATLSPAAETVREVRRLAREAGVDGSSVRLRLTGDVALDFEELKSAEAGGKAAAGLSLAAVLALLGFAYRSPALSISTLVTLVAGLIWSAGFATLAVGRLNLISTAFAVLFVGLGVDFAIHFCLRYREEAASGGRALERAARGTGRGLAIAAAGAGIGFYAFLPTDYRGFAELGLISGSSMFIALGATFTLLPALLATFGKVRPGGLPTHDPWRWLDRTVARHRRAVLFAAGIAGLAGLALLPRLSFDFDPLNLKDPATESFSTYRELVRDPRNGFEAAEVVAPDLAAARGLATTLAGLPEVASVRSIESLVPDRQAEKLAIIEDMAFFLAGALQPGTTAASRESRTEAAKRLLAILAEPGGGEGLWQAKTRLAAALAPFLGDEPALAELEARLTGYLPVLFERLRTALEAGPVGLDDLPAGLARRWLAEDGRARLQVLPVAGLAGSKRFVDAVLARAPTATGTPVMVVEGSRIVAGAFIQATLTAVAAIALLLLLLYRSLTLLALTLAPLALAAVLTLATSALFGPALNFANVIVLPLLFGLGMASAVHLVERRGQLAAGGELMATTTPRAVLFSILTTLASFGSLAVSAHRGMASMGVLLTIAIVYMLLATLVVLPCLMALTDRRSG